MTIKRKIALIVGHTEDNGGALAVSPIDLREYEYNSSFSLELQKYINSKYFNDVECEIFYRDDIGTLGAYQLANEYKATAIVELHFNAVTNSKINGTETLYNDNHEHSRELAIFMQKAICEALRKGDDSRGVKKVLSCDRGWRNLNSAVGPACLVEPFFGSNPSDCELVTNKEDQLVISMGDALYLYVCGYNEPPQ